ncbi:MAG: glycosyltransferase [Eubacterium sp.]|nr:glycosyltransferase [Eubacterium sp.]
MIDLILKKLDDDITDLSNKLAAGQVDERKLEKEFLERFLGDSIRQMAQADISGMDQLEVKRVARKIRTTVTGVFPYWIDNDSIYEEGRKALYVYSIAARKFKDWDEVYEFFRVVKEGDSPIKPLTIPPVNYGDPVSIVMPTYNRESIIAKSIESVLNQTYENWELIVTDDASPDKTADVVAGFDDPRIRYIRSEVNGGTSINKNRGLAEARYDLISFADDDDILHPDKIEKQVRALENAPEGTGFCYCSMVYHRKDGLETNLVPREDIPMCRKSGYIYPELLRRNFVGGPTLMVHRSALDKVGRFHEGLVVFEDWDLALRLSRLYDAAFIEEPLYDYMETHHSLTTRDAPEHTARVQASVDLFENIHGDEKRAFGF